MRALTSLAISTVAKVVLVRHIFGGVRGTVVDGGELPHVDTVEDLKDQLRSNILERRGCITTQEVPQMEPIEVILPPNLNVAEMAQKRGQLKGVTTIGVHHRAVIKDVTGEKGVTVEVIADDAVLPETPVNAEVVIFGPRAAELSEAARELLGDELSDQLEAPIELEVQEFEKADLRFWDNFFDRISSKSQLLDMLDDDQLFSIKDRYVKGYHPIREMGCEIYGIVHVTKNSMNALYLVDRDAGVFRTVTQTKRFNEAKEVGVVEAKAFLNGRY